MNPASAKRLIENPVETFYRDVLEKVKVGVLKHFEINNIDIDVLERCFHKKITLVDEPTIAKLTQRLAAIVSLGVDDLIEKLETHHNNGLQVRQIELLDSKENSPLFITGFEKALVCESIIVGGDEVYRRFEDSLRSHQTTSRLSSRRVNFASMKRL